MSKYSMSLFARAYIAVFLASQLVSATCYLPMGTKATNPGWAPCSNDPSSPMSNICCSLNQSNPSGGNKSDGDTADICLPNGICLNKSVNDQGIMQLGYRRAYCTSEQWESGNCLEICGKEGTGWKDVTPCDGTNTSTRWCCGYQDTDCCNIDLAAKESISVVTLAPTFLVKAAATSPSASQTTDSVSVTTGSPISSALASELASSQSGSPAQSLQPSQSATPQLGLTTGVKVGIAVGAVSATAALLALGALLSRWHRRRQEAQQARSLAVSGKADAEHSYYRYDGNAYEVNGSPDPSEVGGGAVERKPGELFAHEAVSELPGDPGYAKDVNDIRSMGAARHTKDMNGTWA